METMTKDIFTNLLLDAGFEISNNHPLYKVFRYWYEDHSRIQVEFDYEWNTCYIKLHDTKGYAIKWVLVYSPNITHFNVSNGAIEQPLTTDPDRQYEMAAKYLEII